MANFKCQLSWAKVPRYLTTWNPQQSVCQRELPQASGPQGELQGLGCWQKGIRKHQPLSKSLLSESCILYLTLYFLPFNLLVYYFYLTWLRSVTSLTEYTNVNLVLFNHETFLKTNFQSIILSQSILPLPWG